MTEDRLETGWYPDTPVQDTTLRSFLHNQARIGEIIAAAGNGNILRTADAVMVDGGGPVAFLNMTVILRPVMGEDDPLLDTIDDFLGSFRDRSASLLSVWPTPDLTGRGYVLAGHPAWVVRSPADVRHHDPPDVEIRPVVDRVDLEQAERVFVEGYPIHEPGAAEPGACLPPAVLDSDLSVRLGLLDGEPAAVGLGLVADGVVNLCGGATLSTARRRGVWQSLVWARVGDDPTLPAVAFTSDDSRPGFVAMGFVPATRFTLWIRPPSS